MVIQKIGFHSAFQRLRSLRVAFKTLIRDLANSFEDEFTRYKWRNGRLVFLLRDERPADKSITAENSAKPALVIARIG